MQPYKASLPTMMSTFQRVKADYTAGTPSRFRRRRTALGGTADAHITDQQYWNVREYVRDMDRNDAIVGQLVDRAVDNVIGCGFELRPTTGDEGLDNDIKAMWSAWAGDPRQCDIAGKFAFPQMERMVLRHRFIDGDIFGLPTNDGALQLVEGDWCLTASNTSKNVVLGVHIDRMGKPVEYWFAKEFPRTHRIQRVADVRPIAAYDEDGEPNVYHVANFKRATQTRGITAFAPVFDISGMLEDVNFANVVKQQIASYFGVFLKRPVNSSVPSQQFGSQTTAARADGTTETTEMLEPGLMIDLPGGVEPEVFNANIPSAEYFQHANMLMNIIGANLGIPPVLVLMNTSEATWHGYRGQLNQAQIGFRCNQFNTEHQWHRPCYRWKVREWAEAGLLGEKGRAALIDGSLFKHQWGKPAWKAVDPKLDAEANAIRAEGLQASPSQIHAEQGGEFAENVKQTARDNAGAIRAAHLEAKKLAGEGIEVGWRDVLFLTASAKAATTTAPEQLDAEETSERETGKPSRPAPKQTTQTPSRFALLNGKGH